MKNFLFILGATDPEMVEIKYILDSLNHDWIQLDCNPRTAYFEFKDQINELIRSNWNKQVVLIECGNALPHIRVGSEMVIDHHHPAHAASGYSKEHYFNASSIGQLCALLDIIPTRHQVLVGLVDHNLGEIYRNPRFWGFEKHEITAFRRQCIQAGTKSTDEQVLLQWMIAENRFADKIGLVDLTEFGQIGQGYCLEYLLHVECAAANGVAFKLLTKDNGDDRLKLVIGNASSEQVESFMDEYKSILTGVYGVPSRGFAGGYYP